MIVVGSGAGGMLAAIAANSNGSEVVILEKEPLVGGTTGVSGGIIWSPMNHHMKDLNIKDSKKEAMDYFLSLSHGEIDPSMLEAFVSKSAEAIKFMEENSYVSLKVLKGYPDYYLDRPGAIKGGGRALDNELFSFKELGSWKNKVRLSGMPVPMTLSETPLGGGTGHILEAQMHERLLEDSRGLGQALVGGLLKGCLDIGIKPFLESRVIKLLSTEEGINGVEVLYKGKRKNILCKRGVILATGGFEWNKDLVSAFLRGPMTHPSSPPGNTGDGIIMGQEVGGALGNMTSAWWTPVLSIPDEKWEEGSQKSSPLLIERTLPHSIMINQQGKRFCNEATNYSALAGAFHHLDPNSYSYNNLPAWIVFDDTYRSKYATGPSQPNTPIPDWMVEASTLEELAFKLEVNSQNLLETVSRFNKYVLRGSDADFSRGKSDYDSFYGDRSLPGIKATLGELKKPPFYAVEIKMGCLGTNGGLKTNQHGQVVSVRDKVIEGLYAVGNVMSGVTGSVYAGAGGTLGPALTFGYLAGKHCSGSNIKN